MSHTPVETPHALADWLKLKFAERQAAQGQPMTRRAFADYLGLDPTYLHKFMQGKNHPGRANVIKIAARLGPEIYDLLGLERPEPDLEYVLAQWEALSASARRAITDLIAREIKNHD